MAEKKLLTWISTNEGTHWDEKPADVETAGASAVNLRLTGKRDQTWQGFGGCFNELGWIALCGFDEDVRALVMEALFDPEDGCRFNYCRIPLGASDYAANWYSLNEHARDFTMKRFSIERDKRCLIPYVKAALALRPDIQFFASPWSPPTWMKKPPVHNHGTFVMEREYLNAYALYFAKFIQAYAAEGVNIGAIHPQNEPVADQKFPSCVWTGDDMRTFIRDHLGPLFARKRPECDIWLGTLNTSDFDGWAGTILSDPEAHKYVKGVGYQWEGKNALQRTRDSYPSIPMIQTENECGDGKNSWQHACKVFDLMRHYIRNGVSAYCYWNMVLKPGGASTWGWKQNSMVTVDPTAGHVTYNHEFYVMKHFSRFIDPGAVRLAVSGPWAADTVAFENPPGLSAERIVVLVVRNPHGQPRSLNLGDDGATLSVVLGPDSINTLVLEMPDKRRAKAPPTKAVMKARIKPKKTAKKRSAPKNRKKRNVRRRR